MPPALAISLVALAIWLVLGFGRAGFWRFAERDDDVLPDPPRWPSVVAVIPARNEADVIARSLASVAAQDYPGALRIILVDDQSDDGTGDAARAVAASGSGIMAASGGGARVEVVTGAARPPGWTGKLWALDQGVALAGSPDLLWLTDADIGHSPDNLRHLVARIEGPGIGGTPLVQVSLMARLHCASLAEAALIPAFVYFFAMLYPFARVNDPRDRLAAAAGGCVLVRRRALAAAGGIASVRDAIIDDCTLAARIKPQGPLWLGLTDRARSLRPYSFGDIRKMVARSAYTQLGCSPLALAGTLAGMALVYAAPVLLVLFTTSLAQALALMTWLFMALTMLPILRFYGVSQLWAPALPLIALAYMGFTLDSAVQHWRGRGGLWKGRIQAAAAP